MMDRRYIRKYLSLYLVIDRTSCKGRDIFFVLNEAIRGGVSIVQLREKDIGGRDFVDLAKKVKTFLKRFNVPLIINDRVDVALASGADGIHVGQEDIHPKDIRKIGGKDLIVGLSVNNKEHVLEANELDIDYVGIGPAFYTTTKKDTKPILYPQGIKELVKILNKPSVAIGGINEDNCYLLKDTGIDGIAVVSAICGSRDPYLSAKKLRNL